MRPKNFKILQNIFAKTEIVLGGEKMRQKGLRQAQEVETFSKKRV